MGDSPPYRSAKSAAVEIQADEYGGGDPSRAHAQLFANAMDALGLNSTYGHYLSELPGTTLATVNLMSFFGLHRRWLGAIAGHLAAFEIGSARPNHRYARALRRMGFSGEAVEFFDEHVEADSVHENIAAVDLAGAPALQQPELTLDIAFGALALLDFEQRFATHLLTAWDAHVSSLLVRETLRS